ncbi:uncharacterized protein TRIADDRAFT_62484 [Trichoplax adhaerens]|uniref:Uncharacterized protein n=1 Tax=Trichoplax adhaerens TaxID=10228 RepID=B3SDY0_TRIAD|nr:predicted protein [Trichoplax adhaerens]EDV19065.1 predicted protein [Trichoplax adhaerens]|eukprot:XP_002118449.1 predicted protein [Trichoplax adhaerens]
MFTNCFSERSLAIDRKFALMAIKNTLMITINLFVLSVLALIIVNNQKSMPGGTIMINLECFTNVDDKDNSGNYCDNNIADPCEYEFQITLGTFTNSTKYWKFRSKTLAYFSPLDFHPDQQLSDDGLIKTPVAIPFSGPWLRKRSFGQEKGSTANIITPKLVKVGYLKVRVEVYDRDGTGPDYSYTVIDKFEEIIVIDEGSTQVTELLGQRHNPASLVVTFKITCLNLDYGAVSFDGYPTISVLFGVIVLGIFSLDVCILRYRLLSKATYGVIYLMQLDFSFVKRYNSIFEYQNPFDPCNRPYTNQSIVTRPSESNIIAHNHDITSMNNKKSASLRYKNLFDEYDDQSITFMNSPPSLSGYERVDDPYNSM